MEWLEQESQAVDTIAFQLRQAKSAFENEQKELDKATSLLHAAQEAQEVLQHLAQAVQQQAHQKISEVVSSCLSTVFDDPYEFKIVFERKRGRTEAQLRFTRRGIDVDPLTAAGGGMVDVAAFALRIACLVLHRPKLSRVVVLDEPMKFVSAKYRDNVKEMMERISKDMGVQIVQVTHIEELTMGKVIEL